jgi:hypothetical protein
MTLDCAACGGHLFTQGHHDALVCLNTRCALYGQLQPDLDAGQIMIEPSDPDFEDEDDEEPVSNDDI